MRSDVSYTGLITFRLPMKLSVGGKNKQQPKRTGFEDLMKCQSVSPPTPPVSDHRQPTKQQPRQWQQPQEHSGGRFKPPHTQKHARYPSRRPVYESATVHSGSASIAFKRFPVNIEKQTKKPNKSKPEQCGPIEINRPHEVPVIPQRPPSPSGCGKSRCGAFELAA